MTALVRERLAALRDAYGLSDAAMARTARLRQQDVSRFFNGDMKFPALDFMDALARVVDHSLGDILATEMPKSEMPEWLLKAVGALKTMQPNERLAFEMLLSRGPVANGTARPRARRAGRKG